MLKADHDKLPSYEIPIEVQAVSEEIATQYGEVTLYPFPEGHVNLWWRDHGQLHAAMMKLVEDRAEWNRRGLAWHVPAEHATAVVAAIRAL